MCIIRSGRRWRAAPNRAQLSAAYHAMLNDDKTVRLSAGLSGGVVQRSLDFSKLTFDSQWNGYNFDSDLANQETDSENSSSIRISEQVYCSP